MDLRRRRGLKRKRWKRTSQQRFQDSNGDCRPHLIRASSRNAFTYVDIGDEELVSIAPDEAYYKQIFLSASISAQVGGIGECSG